MNRTFNSILTLAMLAALGCASTSLLEPTIDVGQARPALNRSALEQRIFEQIRKQPSEDYRSRADSDSEAALRDIDNSYRDALERTRPFLDANELVPEDLLAEIRDIRSDRAQLLWRIIAETPLGTPLPDIVVGGGVQ